MKKYIRREFPAKLPARHHIFIPALFCIVFCLSGCSSLGFITYYDPTTYKNLTDTKPEVLALYDTFSTGSIDQHRIEAIRLKLAQVYEYEKGKGERNEETCEQIKLIQNMFERHVQERLSDGKWNAANTCNRKRNIADAFDLAIQTERLKNKNE